VTEPFEPIEPPVEPVEPVVPAPAEPSDVERAIADFDAREQARIAAPRTDHTPFSLRDVPGRAWVAVGVLLALVAVGVGGPPWEASFWITLGLLALIGSPFVVGAIFLWQRERR
jgi:hypothetical protein